MFIDLFLQCLHEPALSWDVVLGYTQVFCSVTDPPVDEEDLPSDCSREGLLARFAALRRYQQARIEAELSRILPIPVRSMVVWSDQEYGEARSLYIRMLEQYEEINRFGNV